jgi:DNA-binding NarL/FixJ family response regulator
METSLRLLRTGTDVDADVSCPCPLRIAIISEVRFLRDSLADILRRDPGIAVIGDYAVLADALQQTSAPRANVFLLDATFAGGISGVARIRAAVPGVHVIVFAVVETRENVIAWAEAGIAGYVPNTAGLHDMTSLLHGIIKGKQACTEEVAAGLLRRIADGPMLNTAAASSNALLTEREFQILGLIEAGLGNKDIARHLAISLSTTKAHVHNLLEKLRLQRRGQAAAWIRRSAHGPAARGLSRGGTIGSGRS